MLTGLSMICGRIYGVLSGLTFVAVTIPTICLLTITPGQHNRRKLVQKAAALIFFVTGVTPRVTGQEHLPVGRCVVVANHASYLDGIILTAVLPPRFTFVIKREMTNVPFASFVLRRIGSEFVDRLDHQRSAIDARRIMVAATADQSLAFFPEGTFRSEAGLRSFHNGAFAVARRGKLKLVPVVIRGSREMLPAHRVLPARTKLEVIIRPPVSTDQAGASTRDLKETCRNSILEELNEPDNHR
jgi:1-acyl-sn-glycerol-3-phosphate acyltransferase